VEGAAAREAWETNGGRAGPPPFTRAPRSLLLQVRIYTKPRGLVPDYNAPVILHADECSVENFCDRIHKGILKQFKYA
jgi:hypothetical protein